MGLEDKTIPDSAIKASENQGEAKYGRLNYPNNNWTGYKGVGQWLQVDLGKVMEVMKVATQGRAMNSGTWVTKYSISVSIDEQEWQEYKENGKVKVWKENRIVKVWKENGIVKVWKDNRIVKVWKENGI